MKFCMPHWEGLKTAIRSRGLFDLVSNSQEEAIGKLKDELQTGEAGARNFDPLLSAHNAIVGAALKDAGLAIFIGDRCPLCECDKQQAGLALNWINGSADDALATARQFGLVKLS